MDKLLNMLVVWINSITRGCKVSLETEEKSKDIAFLQGKITGYRLLLSFLKEHFNLSPSFLEDNGESPEEINTLSNDEIDKLAVVIEGLLISSEWERVVSNVKAEKEQLKSFLLHEAENARDLYVSQAQYMAIMCYDNVFANIQAEGNRRKEELPFSDGTADEPGEDLPE